jgi:hypothetical protein
VDKLEEKIRMVIEAIPKSRLIAIFREWQSRMNKYTKNNGDYFE